MIIFSSLGQPLCHQKIVPGNTATGILHTNLIYTEWTLTFTSGGTTEIKVGDWIVGATSAARAEVVSITLASGTWAGGDAAGTMQIKNADGTWTANEKIKVAAGSDDATVTGVPLKTEGTYENKGLNAKAILVSVIAQTALADWDGGKPDQTLLTGHSLVANSSIVIADEQAIKNFKVIDYANNTASTVNVTVYF